MVVNPTNVFGFQRPHSPKNEKQQSIEKININKNTIEEVCMYVLPQLHLGSQKKNAQQTLRGHFRFLR